jgi:galactokinase
LISRVFRAPGRVNLIGEHTDYNLGFVLPIALDLITKVRTTPATDARLRVHSAARGEELVLPIDEIGGAEPRAHWSDYVVGVAKELIALGFDVPALRMHIESTVPEGAGLSSSAALEVSSALALLQGRELDRLEIARLCQRAESNFAGMPCGIMDQYVSLFGQEHAATKIDCRNLESEDVPLPDGVAILAVNSMVKHELGQSAYRMRVAECAEACEAIHVSSLREATLEQVDIAPVSDVIRRRARHIVTENNRVELFVAAVRAGDAEEMGRLFLESHRSMRDDYEISCPEIDFLVDAATVLPGCFGARMTGGGFGGCTVNLVANDAVAEFSKLVRMIYQDRWGIDPKTIRCIPARGAAEVATYSR